MPVDVPPSRLGMLMPCLNAKLATVEMTDISVTPSVIYLNHPAIQRTYSSKEQKNAVEKTYAASKNAREAFGGKTPDLRQTQSIRVVCTIRNPTERRVYAVTK